MPVRKSLLSLVLLLAFALSAGAQPRHLEEGVQFREIFPPVPTASGENRIEVKEIFWYGCPQCYTLEPMMTSWGGGIAGDLDFRRGPAVWNEIMATHARLYFTAEALDVLETIHPAAFHAIHRENRPLATREEISGLFAAHGVDTDAFAQAWNSAAVSAKVDAARVSTGDYGIEKLPSLIVNGSYRVNLNAAVPDQMEMIIVNNLLIRKIRDVRRLD